MPPTYASSIPTKASMSPIHVTVSVFGHGHLSSRYVGFGVGRGVGTAETVGAVVVGAGVGTTERVGDVVVGAGVGAPDEPGAIVGASASIRAAWSSVRPAQAYKAA